MRGLKYNLAQNDFNTNVVAPFAGAWIEICLQSLKGKLKRVAPFAGAWIEITASEDLPQLLSKSHPSRVRGLKYIITPTILIIFFQSHPSRVRGLK